MPLRGGVSSAYLEEAVVTTLVDETGTPISGTNPLEILNGSIKSAANSSTAALASGATFTGTGELNNYTSIYVTVYTDQPGTLYVEFSTNGSNWDSSISYSVDANLAENHVLLKGLRYVRVRFTNTSASPQTYFRLASYYGAFPQLSSALNATVREDADAIVVRAQDTQIDIAASRLQGYSIVNKFGTNIDVDSGTLPEDVWNVGGVYTGFPDTTLETISVLSDSASDAAAGTGARTVTITGLDGSYNVQSETLTLNGVTPVNSVGTYRRMHSMTVVSAGSGGVNAGTITARHTTTTTNVFGSIVPGRNQSNVSAYTVPAGYTGYMRFLHCAIRGTAQSSTVVSQEGGIWTRAFGLPFRLRRPFIVSDRIRLVDTIYGGLVFTEKSDIVIRMTASTDSNVSVNAGYDLLLLKNIV